MTNFEKLYNEVIKKSLVKNSVIRTSMRYLN